MEEEEKELSNSYSKEESLSESQEEEISSSNSNQEEEINSSNSSLEENSSEKNKNKTQFEVIYSESKYQKRKRRSKKEFDGPSYKCPECGKSYLSMPALNTHRRTKHDLGKFGGGRGRGRPRKEPLIISPDEIAPQINNTIINNNFMSYNKIEKKFKHFFEKENRKLIVGEKCDLDFLKKILNDIFMRFKGKFNEKNVGSYDKCSFFKFLIENWNRENTDNDKNNASTFFTGSYNRNKDNNKDVIHLNLNENNNKEIMEKVFLKYLKDCSFKTNKNFFKNLLTFIVLLREGVNFINEDEENIIYSENNNCENLPESLNDIIEKYFEPNFFFGIEQKELVDIITHFSHWLFTNNYTDMKVTY